MLDARQRRAAGPVGRTRGGRSSKALGSAGSHAGAVQDGGRHLVGHRGQFTERAVAVLPLAEVDLRHADEAELTPHVDQERDVDGVAGGHRHAPTEQVGPGGQLAGQGLLKRERVPGRAVAAAVWPSTQ